MAAAASSAAGASYFAEVERRLLDGQAQLAKYLSPNLQWDRKGGGKSFRRWLSNELCLCAAEFHGHRMPAGASPESLGATRFLVEKVKLLAPLFHEAVERFHLYRPSGLNVVGEAVGELVARLAGEFALGADTGGQIATVLARLLWERRLEQLAVLGAHAGNLKLLKRLCDTEAVSLNCFRGGNTPLHVAAAANQQAVVEYIIEVMRGKNALVLNPRNPQSGFAPLHDAAANGHEQIVRLLVETDSAIIDDETADGWTPLLLAAANRRYGTCNYLVYKIASVLHANKWGRNTLDYARVDARLWSVLSDNIRELEDMRHRSKRLQMEVVRRFEIDFAFQRQQTAPELLQARGSSGSETRGNIVRTLKEIFRA